MQKRMASEIPLKAPRFSPYFKMTLGLLGWVVLLLVMLFTSGCASPPVAYDQQFCTVDTTKGCKAWTIGVGFKGVKK